ncbi:hypothetical protein ADN00_12960 [Ornatilinea apprima]|uniref:Uncharacterized protein n=1 Tax=Ornatilinea apprima TaxID=1134406 RepID=A0A0N8GMK4_9CHLR|nr:hypothetical protein ADN00_12960 [Ornatilinea apprima]
MSKLLRVGIPNKSWSCGITFLLKKSCSNMESQVGYGFKALLMDEGILLLIIYGHSMIRKDFSLFIQELSREKKFIRSVLHLPSLINIPI